MPAIRDWILKRHYPAATDESQCSEVDCLWQWLSAPARWGYGLGSAIHGLFYQLGLSQTYCVAVPVISVGNLTTGGTGKTPVVIALSRWLIQRGKRVVVLSRGYGASNPQAYARATEPTYGDEAFLIQQSVPEAVVIVGRDRVANAQRAIAEFSPDVIVLDDGFQHRRLHRAMDMVLIDGQHGLGNGHLLPTGPLRESISALNRAHFFALTRPRQLESPGVHLPASVKAALRTVDQPLWQLPIEPSAIRGWFTQEQPSPETLKNATWVAFSGIAQPERFFESVQVPLQQTIVYADHHVYDAEDIQMLCGSADANTAWITTEKDAVKLSPLWPEALKNQLYVLPVEAQLPEGLLKQLEGRLNASA